jgi:hypothetical protein
MQEPTPPNNAEPASPKQPQHKLWLIIGAAVLVAAAATAAALWLWPGYLKPKSATNTRASALAPTPTPSPAATQVKTTDGAVSFALPAGWKISQRSDAETTVPYGTGTRVLSLSVSPPGYTGEDRWTIAVFKSDAKPKAWSEGPIGLPSASFTKQSEVPINDYAAYYAKVATSSYVDHNYFISADGYIAYFYARESDKHYTPQGVVDRSSDYAKFTSAFQTMANSVHIEAPATPAGYKEYKDTQIGYRLAYPESWGTAVVGPEFDGRQTIHFQQGEQFSSWIIHLHKKTIAHEDTDDIKANTYGYRQNGSVFTILGVDGNEELLAAHVLASSSSAHHSYLVYLGTGQGSSISSFGKLEGNPDYDAVMIAYLYHRQDKAYDLDDPETQQLLTIARTFRDL